MICFIGTFSSGSPVPHGPVASKIGLQITASFTAEPLQAPLERWLEVTQWQPQVAFSGYNQIFPEALDPQSATARNSEGCNVFLIRLADLAEAAQQHESAASLATAIKDLALRCRARHLVIFCPEPTLDPETAKLEAELIAEWSAIPNVDCFASADWDQLLPPALMFDPEADAAGKIPYTGPMFAAIAALIARRLHAHFRPLAKVLVLDADHTLWGGVCGEDDAGALEMEGAFRELRMLAAVKRQEGVLLALCSKNTQADVDHVFAERASCLGLRREDFTGWKVNWSPKSQNLRELASELNLGLDSFIFLDDNPAEIAEVRAHCPEVLAVTLPADLTEWSAFLRHLWPLDSTNRTDEDERRASFYANDQERRQIQASTPSFSEFLRHLDLRIVIEEMDANSEIGRVAQLSKRTNQFNASGLRLSEEEIQARLRAGATCLSVRVRDRFDDYGLVGAMINRSCGEEIRTELFLLSCRAMGKGVERAMLIELGRRAEAANASQLTFAFAATDRNEPCRRFFESIGADRTANGFVLPAAIAASLSPITDDSPALPHEAAPTETAASLRMSGSGLSAETVQNIATVWRDPADFFGKLCSTRRPRPDLEEAYTEPGNPTQSSLAEIWKEVLGLNSVGIHDTFNALGGTSILLVALHSAIRRSFAVGMELMELFELPTIAAQAARIDGGKASSRPQARASASAQPAGVDGIAIIGMALRIPGANDPESLWQNLVNGVESISRFSREELENPQDYGKPSYVPAKGLIKDVDLFDAAFFGILPKDARIMDPQQRIFLELAWEAMERAGYTPETHPQRIGVYAGAYFDTYLLANLCTDRAFLQELIPSIQVGSLQTELGNDKDYLATRAAFKLNLRGPAMTLQTACSTSMVAVVEACRAIRSGLCDMALAGGVTVTLPLKRGYFHTTQGMLSADGHCRAFDAEASGTVFANGAGVVMLKRLSDAIRDRDHIHAVIRGTGLNNDGGVKHSYTAPSVEGQVDVIRMAQRDAGVEAATIGYIEAHGTATPLGDPIEITALTKAFRGAGAEENGFCAIGSLKTNVGHLDVASGVCGLIKTALTLEHQALPPLLHFRAPNPKIDFATSPFRVNTELRPWTEGLHGSPRRAGVSSFGVGGTNAHIILEEAPPSHSGPSTRPNQLFLLSARTPEALSAAGKNLQEFVQSHDAIDPADAAWTLAAGRKPFRCRRAVTARGLDELIKALGSGEGVTSEAVRENPPVILLFPGQGAQHVNMGRIFYESEPAFRSRIDRCAELLRPHLGLSLIDVLYPQSKDTDEAGRLLKQTVLAQPAIFAVEYALGALLMDWGIRPATLIGHSVGEFVAACLAGVFDLESALRLLALRGRLMGELPPGGMLSVRLPETGLLDRLPSALDLAAVNGPSLCVVAGPHDELDAFRIALEADAIATQPLHTSHAFHSRMMEPVVAKFGNAFAGIELRAPEIPILSTVTGEWLTGKETCDPGYWSAHLREPVRFHRSVVKAGAAQPGQIFLETGPGQTLTGIARQSLDRNAEHITVSTCRHVKEEGCDHAHLLGTVGRLWTCGVPIDWTAYYAAEERRRVVLPTYPFERKRHWVDPTPFDALSAQPTPSPMPSAAPAELSPSPMTPAPSIPESRLPALAEAVRALLTDLSGIPADELPGGATFLELGFDSLLLTQVSKALQNQFQTPITLRHLMGDLSGIDAMVAHLDSVLPKDQFRPEPTVVPVVPVLQPAVAQAILPQPSIPAAGNSILQSVILQQLDLMRQQISLLTGAPMAAELPASVPAVAPVSAPVASASPAPALVSAPSTTIQRHFDDSLNDRQQQHLDGLIASYVAKTHTSKELTAKYRQWHADPRTVSGFNRRWKEMIYQISVVRSKGCRLVDVDGNEYIDLLNGFGPNFLGHSQDFITQALHAQLDRGIEVGPQSETAMEAAQLFCEVTGNERASFVNTGSEAVQAAMRLARTVTGRDKIVVFARDYHGNFDEVLVKGAGSGDQLRSLPIAPGIPRRAVEDVIVLPYGTDEALEVIRRRAGELAAVIVEPIQSRRPEFQPREFIRELREITRQSGAVFVFDEVITGFRTGPRGAQEYYGVEADIATYGKVVGGGLPLGVVAGKAEYMDTFDGGMWNYGDDSVPEKGVTFFAGTFVRHPLAMAAVKAVLLHLKAQSPEFWQGIRTRANRLAQSVDAMFVAQGAPFRMPNFGSQMFVRAAEDHKYANLLFFHLRQKGVFLLEGFPTYLTAAHTDEDIDYVIQAFTESVAELQQGGFFKEPSGNEPIYLNGSRLSSPPPRLTSAPEAPAEPKLYPMTESLAEVWLASQIGGNASLSFNELNALTLSGPLNREALLASMQALSARHDSLRAVYLSNGDGFEVLPHVDLPVAEIDLLSVPAVERDAAIEAAVDAEQSTPFDLASGPLVRAVLLRTGTEEHLLLLNAHHLACDGWSYNVMLRELGELYSARVEGRTAGLKPALSFAGYAQRRAIAEDHSPQESFWLKQFEVPVPPLRLPLDGAARNEPDFHCGSIGFTLDGEALKALKRSASQTGTTLFALLLGTYLLLLQRISRQQRFVVWFPAAGQNAPGCEELVGHCVNALPLVAQIEPEISFRDFLKQTQNRVLDALDHQDCTYGRLVKALPPDRRPIIEALFNFERMDESVTMSGLRTSIREVDRRFSTHPLFLKTCETASGLEIRFDFHTGLYREAIVREWLDTYRAMLEAVTAQTEPAVSGILAAISASQEQRLIHWNDTSRPYPRDQSIAELFAATVAQHTEDAAIHCGGESVTYRTLDAMSNRVAHELLRAGVQPGAPVGLFLDRSPELIAGILGILKAGAIYVPIDPAYPADRTRCIIEDSGISVALSEKEWMDRLPREVTTIPVKQALQRGSMAPVPAERMAAPDSPACILYTSGSTGKPKGTILPHRAIVRLVRGTNYTTFTAEEVILQVASICFDATLCEIFGSLLNGGSLVIPPAGLLSVDQIATEIERHGVTQVFLTTSLFEVMVEECLEAFGHLPRVLTGGDIASPAHVAKLLAAHPACVVVNCYGPTENTTFTTYHEIAPEDLQAPRIPIGRAVHNTTAWIVDPSGNRVPPGMPGELLAGGDGLALGYLHRDELTAERFVPDPFSSAPGAKLYRTGDLCRFLADGAIEFLGRLDHQVKIRGFRIEPGEIENQLGRHPGVRQCKVVIRGQGSGEKSLIAYVSPVAAAPPTAQDLTDYLRSKLPAYMVPAAILILPELPMNRNGKVDTHALPDPHGLQASTPEDRPPTATEIRLTELWRQVLGLSTSGLDDDFFALGGHSLLGMKLFSAIQKSFGVPLPLGKLFQAPTIRQLARLIDQELTPTSLTQEKPKPHRHLIWEEPKTTDAKHACVVVPIQPKGEEAPLFAIHGGDGGVLFYGKLANLLDPNRPFYAFESPALSAGAPIPGDTVEETAAKYLRQLRKIQRRGPVHLCGYSFGGVVAYEIACRLLDQGEEVAFLGLIDTENPASGSRALSLAERVSMTWNRDGESSNVLGKVRTLSKRVSTGIVDRLFTEAEGALARNLPSADKILRLRQVQLRHAHERAMDAYEPPKFAGKLTVFRASVPDDKYEVAEDYGWSHLAGELEMLPIPGNHLSVFNEEHLPGMAAAFRRALP